MKTIKTIIGITSLFILTPLLFTLKLLGVAGLTWWMVIAPLMFTSSLFILLMISFVVFNREYINKKIDELAEKEMELLKEEEEEKE